MTNVYVLTQMWETTDGKEKYQEVEGVFTDYEKAVASRDRFGGGDIIRATLDHDYRDLSNEDYVEPITYVDPDHAMLEDKFTKLLNSTLVKKKD